MPPFDPLRDPIQKPYDYSWWAPQFGGGAPQNSPAPPAQTPVNQRGQLAKVIAGFRERGGFNSLDQNKAIQGEHVSATPGQIDLGRLREYASTIAGWGKQPGYYGASTVAGVANPVVGAAMTAAPKVASFVDWGLGQLGFGGSKVEGARSQADATAQAAADRMAGAGTGSSQPGGSPGLGPDDLGATSESPNAIATHESGGGGRDASAGGGYGGRDADPNSGGTGGERGMDGKSYDGHSPMARGGSVVRQGGTWDPRGRPISPTTGPGQQGIAMAQGGSVGRTALSTVKTRGGMASGVLQDLANRPQYARGGSIQVQQPRQSPSTAMPTPAGLGRVQASRITGVPKRYAEGGSVTPAPSPQLGPAVAGGQMAANETTMPAPAYSPQQMTAPTPRLAFGGPVPDQQAPTDAPLQDDTGASTGIAAQAGDPSIQDDGITDNQPIMADEGEFMINRDAATILGPDVLDLLNNPESAQFIHDMIISMLGNNVEPGQEDFSEGAMPPAVASGAQPQATGGY